MYTEMESNLVTWLGDNPMVAELPITARARLRQITLGTPTFNAEGEVDFDINSKSSKIDALKEIISDLDDEPVLIFTHSQRFCPVVVHRLGNRAVEWSGKTSARERERILSQFGTRNGPRYIVATIAAIGEGVDGLQDRCNTEVWLSRSDDRIINEQAGKRLHRRGQKRAVRSIDIIAPNTYDEGILSGQVRQALAMNESMRRERGK
jgi:SNF2 family DNA or RNA helicase